MRRACWLCRSDIYVCFFIAVSISWLLCYNRYFLGTHDQYQTLANALHPIENLTLKERYAISMAPINGR